MILGIEATAHTFGAGISSQYQIKANEKDTYLPPAGGLHPRDTAEHHANVSAAVIERAIKKAKVSFSDIKAVAYSKGPGLGPCLQTGLISAQTISYRYNIPLIGVNHCIAHIEIGKYVTGIEDPVIVYVSGGNTQIIALEGRRYRIFGETLDISLGNLFDQFARYIGLKHPGGPKIEKLALKGDKLIDLPYVVKGMDLSYSGILTEAKKRYVASENLNDICYSLEIISFSMLSEVTERAMAHTGKNNILLVGGVAANRRLFNMMNTMAEERGGIAKVVDPEYAADNGAMIAYTGEIMYNNGITETLPESCVIQRYRTDSVEIIW